MLALCGRVGAVGDRCSSADLSANQSHGVCALRDYVYQCRSRSLTHDIPNISLYIYVTLLVTPEPIVTRGVTDMVKHAFDFGRHLREFEAQTSIKLPERLRVGGFACSEPGLR